MKKLFDKMKKNYKKIVVICVFIYVAFTFVNQQKTLNSYKSTQTYYAEQIETQKAYKSSLYDSRGNVNSKEYIENVAREKLDMYLPNERVYIDKGK